MSRALASTTRPLTLALVVGSVLLAAACGGGDAAETEASPSPSGSPSATEEGTAAGEEAFPVTVDTVFGEVTVDERPERIVALGWSDAETALALGVEPVGASDWLAFGGDGVGPWSVEYTTSPEILGTLELDYEAVAALEPDLILNTRSSADPAVNEQLSAIAPTVGVPEGVETLYGTTWDQQVEIVAAVLGLQEEGAALIEDTQATITEAASANPQFEGTTAAVGSYFSGSYGGYVNGDARADLLTAMGFVTAPDLQAAATESFYVPLSGENLNLLDADVTVMFPLTAEDATTLENDALLQQIPSAQAGRLLVLDDMDLISAFSSASALGTQTAVAGIVPLLAQATS